MGDMRAVMADHRHVVGFGGVRLCVLGSVGDRPSYSIGVGVRPADPEVPRITSAMIGIHGGAIIALVSASVNPLVIGCGPAAVGEGRVVADEDRSGSRGAFAWFVGHGFGAVGAESSALSMIHSALTSDFR
jgi:hypothetical protein